MVRGMSTNESTTGGASAAEWLISVDDHVIEPPNAERLFNFTPAPIPAAR